MKRPPHGAHATIEQARRCCETCTIIYQTAASLTQKAKKKAIPKVEEDVAENILNGRHQYKETMNKILFEFKPFMDGYYKFKELLK